MTDMRRGSLHRVGGDRTFRGLAFGEAEDGEIVFIHGAFDSDFFRLQESPGGAIQVRDRGIVNDERFQEFLTGQGAALLGIEQFFQIKGLAVLPIDTTTGLEYREIGGGGFGRFVFRLHVRIGCGNLAMSDLDLQKDRVHGGAEFIFFLTHFQLGAEMVGFRRAIAQGIDATTPSPQFGLLSENSS